ncbi:MAG: hypothetical protein KBA81_05495 [Rhabdochlamydiaceae bacterium]|nr:hypothetical protein [Rhabdochlamydiaceae bacterium]
MSIIGVSDYVWTTFRHAALCAGVSYSRNLNDPRAAALTAIIEVALNSILASLYTSKTGKKITVSVADLLGADPVSIKEFCLLSLSPNFVSAQLSRHLGYNIKITNYMIVSELCKLGYSTVSLGLLMAKHNRAHDQILDG